MRASTVVGLAVAAQVAAHSVLLASGQAALANCTFDNGKACAFTSDASPFKWTLRSGSTPTAGTGPDGGHTQAGSAASGSYVYVESSSPNHPFKGPFILAASFGEPAGATSFWYNMYGLGVGSLGLEVSSDGGATWHQEWAKQGNQGAGWRRAAVTLATRGAQGLRFVGQTGTDFLGDMALDDVAVASVGPSASPSATPAPSLTASPTQLLTGSPTPEPSTALVTTPAHLQGAIASGAHITLGADVALGSTIVVAFVGGVEIDGADFTVDGRGAVGCFYVTGHATGTDVTLRNVHVTGGYTGSGGGFTITSGIVRISNSTISNCTAVQYGGAIHAWNCELILTKVVVDSCASGIHAGAISLLGFTDGNYSGSYSHFEDCVFTHNVAAAHGGVFFLDVAVLNLVRCNLTENTAKSGSGAIHLSEANSRAFIYSSYIGGNVALDSSGGGIWAEGGATLNISDSIIQGNRADGKEFVNMTTGLCTISGDCILSPNYPDSYNAFDNCHFDVVKSATIITEAFSTQPGVDVLVVAGTPYSGYTGPAAVLVQPGDVISFTSDGNGLYPGFQICTVKVRNGGGLYVTSGASAWISGTTLSGNSAASLGGGLFLSKTATATVAQSSIHANVAVLGGGAYVDQAALTLRAITFSANVAPGSSEGVSGGSAGNLNSGSIEGYDITLLDDDFAGESSKFGIICHSVCIAGEYGTCAAAPGAPSCSVNCGACPLCGAGTFSAVVGASSPGVCSPCGAGQVSQEGAATCAACSAGTWATSNSSDNGGGQAAQVLSGAKYCNPCPAGRFSATSFTIVCQGCAAGKSSGQGDIACELCPVGKASSAASASCADCAAGTYAGESGAVSCAKCGEVGLGYDSPPGAASCGECLAEYFKDPNGVCVPCPNHATCLGGDLVAVRSHGFWMDLTTVDAFSANNIQVYRCPYALSCKQVDLTKEGNMRCWTLGSILSCDSNQLQCTEGSFGPLCGSCSPGWYRSTVSQTCLKCGFSWVSIVIAGFVVPASALLAWGVRTHRFVAPAAFLDNWLVGTVIELVDGGLLRVIISTYQIIHSVSWSSLNVPFPEPFRTMLNFLSLLSFNFLSSDCLHPSYFFEVYLWSVWPLLLGAIIAISFLIRRAWSRHHGEEEDHQSEKGNQHFYAALLLTYFVLPVVSRAQLQALECVNIAGHSVMRVETSISCGGASYEAFRAVNAIFILVYLSMPICWMVFLYRHRKDLNPGETSDDGGPVSVLNRTTTETAPLMFLWGCYRPEFYFFEVIEMYRRIMLISALPLMANMPSRRASIGVALSLTSIAFFRETEPFLDDQINCIAYIGQYSILLTYLAALIIDTGVSKKLNHTAFGLILMGVNVVVISLAVAMSFYRHSHQLTIRRNFGALTTQQHLVLNAVMRGEALDTFVRDDRKNSNLSTIQLNDVSRDAVARNLKSEELFARIAVPESDIVLEKRIGAGSFGEVFRGTCAGQPCAIKTMLNFSETNAKAFRAEILLTSNLHHPNIVGFIGACWSHRLVCLVLEWVEKGSLRDLLWGPSRAGQTWNDPLLRLCSDVARGMCYLHQRTFYDEADGARKSCVIHRDLKPDNCLVTSFISAKVTDFGSSRSKALGEDATMTAVGTPFYAAPELVKGEAYDESVDVYSFGLLLIDCAVLHPLDFLAERWRIAQGKAERPKQFQKVIRSMEDGWRPVGEANPIPWAPAAISALVGRCMNEDPKLRPSFAEVREALGGEAKAEVDDAAAPFLRHAPRPAKQQRAASSTASSDRGDSSQRKSGERAQSRPSAAGGGWASAVLGLSASALASEYTKEVRGSAAVAKAASFAHGSSAAASPAPKASRPASSRINDLDDGGGGGSKVENPMRASLATGRASVTAPASKPSVKSSVPFPFPFNTNPTVSECTDV